MKRPPKVLKEYPSLPRNPSYPLQEFKLRVVKYHNSSVLLDIREYITSDAFTGFSPKGISLTREQVIYLVANGVDMLDNMKEKVVDKNQMKLPLVMPEVTNEDNS